MIEPSFSDELIIADILGSRLGHALHKINFRQMLALESIAADLQRMMHPAPQLAHPSAYQPVEGTTGDPLVAFSGGGGTGAAYGTASDPQVAEIGPALQHSRRRRQSGVPE